MAITLSAHAETLRDPTLPLGHVNQTYSTQEKPLQLQSVLVSDTRKVAYINGQQLREQDVIMGRSDIKVIRIETSGVTLQQGSKRWQLHLDKVMVRY